MATRHLCGLSGGRDSAALAVWLQRERPELEVLYHFSDSGCELPETYEFLDGIEASLGIKINRLQPPRSFEELLRKWDGMLPGFGRRWCTERLKIYPFKRWIKPWQKAGDSLVSYVGIRADEGDRAERVTSWTDPETGMLVEAPLADAGIDLGGVHTLLESAGVALPSYYEWRSRSGCFFCWYQRPVEWLGLLRRHPELYAQAEDIERRANAMRRSEEPFYWRPRGESLVDLRQPGRIQRIERWVESKRQRDAYARNQLVLPLGLEEAAEDAEERADDGPSKPHLPCLVCHK